eukprot:TRINITY_DN13706_c0_g1_i1.p1 TRINITY_DN13706_c0_g1~~TRINITY_DN13706_c0_g1_i1.p1  ORF type:complete len:289 (+),score=22.38 TRINITY_DN13706_c0_g1_i1:62-928(+)
MASSIKTLTTDFSIGWVAGGAGILASHPFDTIRVRLQTSGSKGGSSMGILSCARMTLQNEGIRGFYKGVASPTVFMGIMNAICFATYERSSGLMRAATGKHPKAELPLGQVFLSGASAGFLTCLISGPADLVKCVAQTDTRSTGKVSEELALFRRLVREHGWLGAHGPCRGILATLMRDSPAMGSYFCTFEAIARTFDRSTTVSFFAGGTAGAISWGFAYPADVLKTRWQVAPVGKYRSLLHCGQTILAEEGIGAFYRGFVATLFKSFPQNAVVFASYVSIKRNLGLS